MPDSLILALDFGGTKHAAAVCRRGDRTWRGRTQALAPAQADATVDLEIMARLWKEALAGDEPSAVGVSFGGPVDFDRGIVRLSHHVPGWEGVPLKEILEHELKSPVIVDNDANAGAIGEYHLGAGAGCQSMLYITVSSGVGGGWVLGGQPWRGAGSMAGEIGHMTLDPEGPVCLCGKRGCLERFASGRYIAEDIRHALQETAGSGGLIRKLAGGELDRITGRMVAEAAALGDDLAKDRLDQAAWAIGAAIGNCANLISMERVILGGGVAGAGESFWERLRAEARRVALPEIEFKILPAALGADAPLWGAAILAGR